MLKLYTLVFIVLGSHGVSNVTIERGFRTLETCQEVGSFLEAKTRTGFSRLVSRESYYSCIEEALL